MTNRQAALIAAAILSADGGAWSLSVTKDLAEKLESWLDGRP